MAEAGNPTNIIILDACRDNRYSRGLAGGVPPRRGLRRRPGAYLVAAPGNPDNVTVRPQALGGAIAFAAQPGQVASDGASGGHGLFTGELLKALDECGLTLEEVVRRVIDGILMSPENHVEPKQRPWMNSSMTDAFYFNNCGKKVTRIGHMVAPHITDPAEIERLLEIRLLQARRLAKTMSISLIQSMQLLYGEEADRLR